MEIFRDYVDALGNHFVASFQSPEEGATYAPPPGSVPVPPRPSVDHVWSAGEWAYRAPVEPPPVTPSDVNLTDRQLRIGLLSAGYDLALIETSIEAIPNPIDRAIARVWWDRTTVILWDHPMTQTLMGLAGIPEIERTSLWMWASDIAA